MKASPLGTVPSKRACSSYLHSFPLRLLLELPGSSGLRAHQDSEKVRKRQVILLVGEGTLRVSQDARRGRKPSKRGNLQLPFCTLCMVQKDQGLKSYSSMLSFVILFEMLTEVLHFTLMLLIRSIILGVLTPFFDIFCLSITFCSASCCKARQRELRILSSGCRSTEFLTLTRCDEYDWMINQLLLNDNDWNWLNTCHYSFMFYMCFAATSAGLQAAPWAPAASSKQARGDHTRTTGSFPREATRCYMVLLVQ